MDFARFAIRRDRHQTERATVRAVGGEVKRPEPTDCEWAAIGSAEIIGGLQFPFRLPFVIAVDRDDTATMAGRVTERRAIEDAFRPGVGVAFLFVGRRPGPDENPRERFGGRGYVVEEATVRTLFAQRGQELIQRCKNFFSLL